MNKPKVICVFENSNDFARTDVNDFRDDHEAIIYLEEEQDTVLKVNHFGFDYGPLKKFSVSPINGQTPLSLEINDMSTKKVTYTSLNLLGLVTFDGLEKRTNVHSSTHCEFTTQTTSTSPVTKLLLNLGFSVDFAKGLTSLNLARIPFPFYQDFFKVSVTCPELIPISHNPDNTTYTSLTIVDSGESKYYNSVVAPTLSPSAGAPDVRPKPPARHEVESLTYAVDLIPRLSRVQIGFQFTNTEETTVWDNTTVDLVLGNNPTGVPAGSKAQCELTAQTQTTVDIVSVETKQASTYFKTFTLDYVSDSATKLLRLQGTMPTFGMKFPKINCYISNGSDFTMDSWTFKDKRSKNKVLVGDVAIPADGAQPAIPLESSFYTRFQDITFDTMDGEKPLGITFSNVASQITPLNISFPELITFKEYGNVMKKSVHEIECKVLTKHVNPDVDVDVETTIKPLITLDLIDGSFLQVTSLFKPTAASIKITCDALTPVSHYYQNQFYGNIMLFSDKRNDSHYTQFLVKADTQTIPPQKDDPVRPPKPVDPEDDEDPDETSSSAALKMSLTVAVCLMAVVAFIA